MLEPNSRRLLMESLQPPDGYRLDWAVGTTYTLDLIALLTAPVAFAFSDWQDRDGRPTCDPLALLKAVRQYARRVCIFCQAGKIQVPSTYQPLLASLEDSVYEACAPKGGSFHPKLWFLRFVSREEDEVVYRVLCASRNMTFDRSWDTLLCLEGTLKDRVNAFRRNHPLGAFVEALPGMSGRSVSKTWLTRIRQLAHEIRRVDFEAPEPFQELEFWPLGIDESERLPFPNRIDRMFVVSPFVDDGLLGDLHEWGAPMELLSRAERLAMLSRETLAELEKAWVLDDTANPEPGDAEEEAESGEGTEKDDIPLVGLHAKAFVVDEGWNAHVFTGSANATRAAFRRNVEFLVELVGKKSQCGIAAMLGQASEPTFKKASSLADLLQPYVAKETEPSADQEVEKFERQVDEFAKQLSQAVPVANCEPSSTEETFLVAIFAKKKLKIEPSADWNIRIRPASLPDSHLCSLDFSADVWASFAAISLLGLTSFFVIEIRSPQLKTARRFVLNIPLTGVPENRDEAILRELLSDRDRVLRFLILLLLDSGARDLGKIMQTQTGEGDSQGFMESLFGATLFESLLKALHRDPERLEQVAEVIQDLRKTDEGQRLLPEDLQQIWEPIWAVRAEELKRRNQRHD
ncbi:phospholipase D family protein [Blastopirellula marina]|uniref:PLD phosphodiesterase domain-containing protein n=1 Tax=Blastopirellula marina TaxID=124 RepID=A0A2S8FA33_9BACT|nr:phospholipase D family protein [Blastopirellula marina]PQO29009.1 hypothetical protein C5Y98_22630 [Blastopirellula marina]PTL42281.1 hypothetical protein C5Y97_22640 [Blastopirellula marina]